MPHSKRVLLAVDESEVSDRVVAYVADVLGGGSGVHVGLLHLEPPPRMLEWGGSENPTIEDRVSSERRNTYRQMEQQAVAEGKAMLQRYRAMLVEKGIDADELVVEFNEPLNPKHIADTLLKTAEERDYGTVVVGRHLFSFWEGIVHHHVAQELVNISKGIAIWVVG